MTDQSRNPEPTCKAGDRLEGFRIERVTPVPEIRATAYEATHLFTGARLLHLHCDDRENLYAVTFRTPPPDSTGVAHILEHSVLAGSRKYPVKDAFNELAKASLKTFLNAFTAPDFTSYPVASQVRADFYNLASVYTDLVLCPLLSENTFRQEGHHLEVGEDGALTISGIVYNEMKGALSTPEAVAERGTIQALFPDTPYGVESGGDPEHIPDLTYQQFTEFHRSFYSPSNALVFFYGNIATADHLRFMAQRLDGFQPVEVRSAVPDQSRWTVPRLSSDRFPIGPDDSADRRSLVNVGWLTAGVEELEERVIHQVLEEALVGNAGSPLRKALIDSGLGEDLSPTTGLHTWFRQIPFVVGLRGTDPDLAEKIEATAASTLSALADQGLPRDLLEAAFHQVEFKGLEITRTPHSFPVTLLVRVLGTWLHDHDPLVPLRFPTLIAGLRQRWERTPDLFQAAVRRWLVDNPHRIRAVIVPSRTGAAESESRVRERLTTLRARLSDAEVAQLRRVAETLHESQRAKDSPEALATLPRLKLSEIPREVDVVPTVETVVQGATVLEHDVFTNGIAYLDVVFDVADVAEELQPYLPFLAASATGMGAAGERYEVFATRKALYTGGVSMVLRAREHLAGGAPVQTLILSASALTRNANRMVDVVRDILLSGDLSDRSRLKDVLSEKRNGQRASVAPRGHMYGWMAAASPSAMRRQFMRVPVRAAGSVCATKPPPSRA
ncbi:MAG: insulinase family protein, partial [Candidatus Riflebacteria bacterium]|nr:insulinase family protein [Candidatus Riflebacteria bacterium]